MAVRASLENLLSREWQRRGVLAHLLWPLSLLFGALVALRRWLYAVGLRQPARLPVPVIVVGNIYLGGTGKTPLVIWLVEHLRERGYTPGVISRGHGSDAHSVVEVHDHTDVAQAGDEPLLIRQRTAVPVFVGRRRVAAARALLAAHPAVDLLISDDGLQHYALGRDLEILLSDERGHGNGWLLPAGPLREPVSRRADVRVVHTSDPARLARSDETGATLFPMRLLGQHAWPLANRSVLLPLASLPSGARIVAAAGIGNPARFFGMLRQRGVTLADTLPLPDHFDFSDNPFAALQADLILITEKDAVKCARIEAIASDPRLRVVPVQADIDGPLADYLVEKLRGHPTA